MSGATCKALLEQFHVPCDTSSCSSKNDKTYQLNIDQVCAAVDTPIKLLMSAIEEQSDG